MAGNRFKSIQTKMGVCVFVLVVALAIGGFGCGVAILKEQGICEAEARASSLASEASAAWDYIARTNNGADSAGSRYQGFECVLAVKSIAADFNAGSDTLIRFVSDRPRNKNDKANAFEEQALQAFSADGLLASYGAFDESASPDGMYYYFKPMRMGKNCESCHGGPAGEKDELGYFKEGYREGELIGALSVAVPVGSYGQASAEIAKRGIALFFIGLLAVVAVMSLVIRATIVKPVRKLSEAADAFSKGEFDHRVPALRTNDELSRLAADFNEMASELQSLYDELENRVDERTRDLRKKSEELRRSNITLEKSRAELAKALAKLEDEQKFRNNYFAYMSHELRTPLTSILAFAQLFAQKGQDALHSEGEVEQAFGQIAINARSLVDVVNNILLFSKGEAGMLALHNETVDMADAVEAVRASFEPLAEKNGIVLDTVFEGDIPLVVADKEMIRSVLTNYVGNALKYTPRGGCVRVVVSWDARRGEACLSVDDTGIGIADEFSDDLFKPYMRAADSNDSPYVAGGTGLGLAVVSRFADLCSGRAFACAKPEGGSVFYFVFPAEAVDEEAIE